MEGATRIVAIRHGETDWNTGGRIQGHTDIALNERGRWQAGRLAQALAHEPFDAVYTSDLARAHETAAALAQAQGLPLAVDTSLRERGFGSFEGLTFAEIEQRHPEDARRWRQRDPEFGPPGGEPLRAFYERSVGTALRLAAAHAGGSIALVAHGGVLDCLYRAAGGIELQAPRTWQVANASINRLLYNGSGLALVGWSDVFHLEGDTKDDDPRT